MQKDNIAGEGNNVFFNHTKERKKIEKRSKNAIKTKENKDMPPISIWLQNSCEHSENPVPCSQCS